MRYYSQGKQDEYIDKVVLAKKRNGFFIEIGAYDGITFSNSYFFEKNRAFDGVCVEPNPDILDKLKANRKCIVVNACVSNKEGIVHFLSVSGGNQMLSGIIADYHPLHLQRIEEEKTSDSGQTVVDVATIRFENLLSDKERVIDYLSIDTEGNEYNILQGIEFQNFNISCISVENNYGNEDIEILLANNGFIKVYRTVDDDVFIRKDIRNTNFRLRNFFYYMNQKYKNQIVKIQKIFGGK